MKTRKSPRAPTAVRGRVRSERGLEWVVDLSDFSAGGCSFPEPGVQLSKGERIRMHIADQGVYRARVSWRRGKNVGIAFDVPLTNEMFERLTLGDQPGSSSAISPNRLPC